MSVARTEDAANWWVLVAVGTGTFMSALDGSIANTVLPVLTHSLHGTVASVEWVITVYLLVTSALLLSAGRWGDLHGHKPMYLTGFALFILGSALCGLATIIPVLVTMRGLQALGATLLFASSPAIVTLNFPASRRGQALGLQATLTYLGLSTGPILGGWLTTHFSWHAVFYINVPVGLLAFGLSKRFIPEDAPRSSTARFDIPGAALFGLGLVALMLALNQGHAWGWVSAAVDGLLALAALLLTAFVLWERRTPSPMLDFGLFRDRSFSAATISALLNFVSLNGLLFLLPFYLISGRGLSAAQAGVIIAALPISMALVAPGSGWLSDRVGTALPATIGMILLAAGTLLLSRIGPHTSLHIAAAELALSGVGIGIFLSPNNSALMGSARRDQQGIASGIRATARNLGNVLGIGVVGAVFNSVLAHHEPQAALFPAVHAGLLTVCLAACLGVFASAVRGRPRTRPVEV
ncbi:MAG: MFS transporter [Janthinobacterium lividum]